jgi:serine/threonine protein kinase
MDAILSGVKLPEKRFGKPISLTSHKGRINPDFDRPKFMEKMSRFELLLREDSHHILLNGRNRIFVVPFPISEENTIKIVIKEFFTRGLKKIKTLVLPSKAKKAWRGGVALMKRGIPTPVPVGYLESRRSPFIKESCYLSVMEEGVDEIRHLFRHSSGDELESLVQALAHHLNLCHQKGILHRDLSDGNILVKKNAQNKLTFFLIDTNRIRLKKRLSLLSRTKNLIRLGIPPEYQRLFLEFYSAPGGLKKRALFWYKFRKKTYTWHIDIKKKIPLRRESKSRNSV